MDLWNRSAFLEKLRYATGNRNAIQIDDSLVGGCNEYRAPVGGEREFVDREVRLIEQGALGAGRLVIKIQIPAIRFEARPSLRLHGKDLSVRRECGLLIRS